MKNKNLVWEKGIADLFVDETRSIKNKISIQSTNTKKHQKITRYN